MNYEKIEFAEAINYISKKIKKNRKLTIIQGEFCDIETLNIIRKFESLKHHYNIKTYNSTVRKDNINNPTITNMSNHQIYFIKNLPKIADTFKLKYTIPTDMTYYLNSTTIIENVEGRAAYSPQFFVTNYAYNSFIPTKIQKFIIDSINQSLTIPNQSKRSNITNDLILTINGPRNIKITSQNQNNVVDTISNYDKAGLYIPTILPINERNLFRDILGKLKKTAPITQDRKIISTKSLLLYIFLTISNITS